MLLRRSSVPFYLDVVNWSIAALVAILAFPKRVGFPLKSGVEYGQRHGDCGCAVANQGEPDYGC